ncbi:OmpA family protein [Plastoroseomonas arctica]|uniref:OmpA family protein n=1 Tax=Plastoroseomonas arctica TaxID=1509237 RepID=A0AAF1KJF1_9PROT|nr:OmpA family protein [Plastoroseomonas arctica]MBR0655005.1 OmpA family protein [Plastoroseomonas arctica]
MSLKKALLAATMLALPLAAQAQPVTGIYIGAGAGLNYLQTTKDNGARVSSDIGFAGVFSVGYGFGNGLRLEVEGNFRINDADRISSRTGGRFSSGGTIRSYGAMANILYEFPLGPVQPYIGGGVGYVIHDYDVRGRTATRTTTINDDEGNFAFQGIVGLAFPIAAVPGLAITAEYRFLGTLGHELERTERVGNVTTRSTFDADNYNHSILAGLRYNFGQVARVLPPAIVTPQGPARTYIVFFDWNRSDLTERARQIIGEAASASTSVASTRIEVAGHADRSGTPAYNQGLSQRRANTVAAELVRRGVNRSNIAISAFGETRPLVPTADGVREPQNRRVEIVLR